jgi:hypothetical protein
MRALLPVLATFVLVISAGSASAYSWPLKPFDKQHPVRGNFGDPRTVFANGIFDDPFDSAASLSFHQGVDIAAPDGTPIYPVAGGIAHYLDAATLEVYAGHGVRFQYFHIISIVGEGEHVVARKTILGYVQPPYGHVHLGEIDGTHIVNPLQRGHLTPYIDHTRPTITNIIVKDQLGIVQEPLGLCGKVELDVDAFDTTPIPVPGSFHGMPVAPAYIAWRLVRLGDPLSVPWKTLADFRHTVPPNNRFYEVYARGTYQNFPRFGREQYSQMPGRYLFLISPSFDTRVLANGVYQLTVRAADVRGNSTTATRRISVLNGKGACPGSLPGSTSAPPASEPPSG